VVPEWESEIVVGEDLARRLIAARFPTLDVSTLRPVGEGWDNTVWATADGVAFRFPRRQIAVPGIERELAVLPGLAAQLPTRIPDAAFTGAPSAEYPWPWFGSRLIAGREIAAAALGVGERGRLAAELGRFLGRLHGLAPAGPTELPIDPMGRADMQARVPRAREALGRVAAAWAGGARAESVLDAAGELPRDRDAVLVHGDLHLRHALVSDAGGLAGVIDWGDLCRAPRSVDLSLYWSLFDAGGRVAFREAYGPLSDATLARARVLALYFGGTLAAYALDVGMDALAREALDGLERTLVD
jgi:aminoglycoside phosphotransferase (APT) family kinase protein